jgi:segregation and condensation protein B
MESGMAKPSASLPHLATDLPLKAQVEALLYLKGKALSLTELCQELAGDRPSMTAALLVLMQDYRERESALEVVETDRGYALRLRSECQELVKKVVPADLGRGTLKTLAAIALRGPVLQTMVVEWRGASAYEHIRDLVAQGFVRKRRAKEGRSYLLQVTEKFHQYFEVTADTLRQRLALPWPAPEEDTSP